MKIKTGKTDGIIIKYRKQMKSEENVAKAAKLATNSTAEAEDADKMATAQNPAESPAPEAEAPEGGQEPEGSGPGAPQDSDEPEAEARKEAPASLPADWEAQLAEAEQRGYMRGRNESIERLMKAPAMYERADPAHSGEGDGACGADQFLARRKVSIWNL